MLKFSAVSQIWKKYIQKLNDWDLSLTVLVHGSHLKQKKFVSTKSLGITPS